MSLLVRAFDLQAVRGHAFAILTYACAARSLTLGPSILHAAALCHPYRCRVRLVFYFLHDTPFFNRHIQYLTISSPGEVPRSLLDKSGEAMGNVRYVDW